MEKRDLQKLAKVLSYVLGVRPDEFALLPQPDGFVSIKELIQAMREEEEWSHISEVHLRELIHGGYRGQFELSQGKIRTTQATINFVPEPTDSPPPRLFCGVRRRAHWAISQRGLKPFKDGWVVLARTKELAVRMGKRRDPEPLVVEVKAQEAWGRGIRFFSTQGELFVSKEIPPQFLLLPPLEKGEEKKTFPSQSKASKMELPGSFSLEAEFLLGPKGPKGEKTVKRKDPSWRRERRERRRR